MFDYEGEITSCGEEIAWVTTKVAPTRAVLNATIREMFTTDRDLGFEPGNVIAHQGEVTFEDARINNGIAKIYLKGQFSFNNECDALKPLIQLEESALQFDTVNTVQIFSDGELVR